MTIKQLSVFIENKRGRLAEITNVLRQNSINIRALSIADTKEFGILRLIVSDVAKAAEVLREDGFTVSLTDVVAIGIEDRPGGLAEAMAILDTNEISVEYMYAFISRTEDTAYVIMRVADNDAAIRIFTEAGFELMKDIVLQ